MMTTSDNALVLFSGGQDSTTCLAWALARYPHVETVGFAYGQRHAIELECRDPIRTAFAHTADWGARLGPDHLVDMRASMTAIGETALTANMAITMTGEGLPSTFVPGRNLLFLTYAAAIAYRRGITRIVAGMCETDYSGYPRLPRRRDQGDAACAERGNAAALRSGDPADVAGQGGDLGTRRPAGRGRPGGVGHRTDP